MVALNTLKLIGRRPGQGTKLEADWRAIGEAEEGEDKINSRFLFLMFQNNEEDAKISASTQTCCDGKPTGLEETNDKGTE